jgi:hypothetical protein
MICNYTEQTMSDEMTFPAEPPVDADEGGSQDNGGLPEIVFANPDVAVMPSAAIIHDNETFLVQWSAFNTGQADSEAFIDNLTIYSVPDCPGSDDNLTAVWDSDADGDPQDFQEPPLAAQTQGPMMQPTVGPFPAGFYRLTVTLNSGNPPADEQDMTNNLTYNCIEIIEADTSQNDSSEDQSGTSDQGDTTDEGSGSQEGDTTDEGSGSQEEDQGFDPAGVAEADTTLAEGGGAPTYDAAAAVAYARKFWNRPCTDLRIAPDLGQHPELTQRGFIDASSVDKFLKRQDEQAEDAVDAEGNLVPKGSWDFLDDCTHFISCCIGRPPATAYPKNDTPKAVSEWRANTAPAGGLLLPNHSLDVTMYGLAGLDRLVEFLTAPARQWATKLANDISKDVARPLMDKMMPGDLIAYSHGGKFDHLVILLGDNGKLNGKVACHTYCRSDASDCTWDNDWDAISPPGGDYHVTLLQMPRRKKPAGTQSKPA